MWVCTLKWLTQQKELVCDLLTLNTIASDVSIRAWILNLNLTETGLLAGHRALNKILIKFLIYL